MRTHGELLTMENEKSKETILDTDTKGVPCSFFIPPSLFLFSSSLPGCNECGRLLSPQSVWGHRDSRCYSMQILPPFPAQQHSELTLLPSCVLPFAFHTVVGKKKKHFKKKHLIIVLKRLIYTLHSAFGLSTAGGTKQQLTHFWHWREFDVLIT